MSMWRNTLAIWKRVIAPPNKRMQPTCRSGFLWGCFGFRKRTLRKELVGIYPASGLCAGRSAYTTYNRYISGIDPTICSLVLQIIPIPSRSLVVVFLSILQNTYSHPYNKRGNYEPSKRIKRLYHF
jgi:hypothetical protein